MVTATASITKVRVTPQRDRNKVRIRTSDEIFESDVRSCYTVSNWEVALLGKVQLRRAGELRTLTNRQAQLLAVVAIASDAGIERPAILQRMWTDEPTHKSSPNLRNMFTTFKREFEGLLDVGTTLRLGPGVVLDLHHFDDLTQKGMVAAQQGRSEQAVYHYRSALGLWRGDVLAEDLDQSLIDPTDTVWDGKRSDVLEALTKVLGALGKEQEVVALLKPVIADGNDRIKLITALVEALYRTNQVDEADRVLQKAISHKLALAERIPPGWISLQDFISTGDPLPRTTESPIPAVPHLLARACASFVGRVALVEEIGSGIGRATLLVGPSGIGKTAIAGCVASAAVTQRTARVLLVRCEPTDQQPLDAFFRAVGKDLGTTQSAYDWVITQMEDEAQLMVFDDVHHGDTALLQLIAQLSINAVGERLGMVITAWPGSAATRLTATDAIDRHAVSGLTVDELRQFCEVALQREFANIPSEFVVASSGNPMMFRRLVAESGDAPDFHKFSAADRYLALCAALLGPTIHTQHCSDVLGLTHGETLEGMARLEASGLIALDGDGIRFTHELLRTAVLDTLAGIGRASLASRIVRCEALPDWIRGRHAVTAAPVEDHQFVTQLLERAVKSSEDHSRWVDVCELSEMLASRTSDPQRQGRLLLQSALAAEQAGRFDATERRRKVLDFAESVGDLQLALDSVLINGHQARSATQDHRVSDINRVLALVGSQGYPDSVVRLRAERLAWMGLSGRYAYSQGDIAWADSFIEEAHQTETSGAVTAEVIRAWLSATLGTTDVTKRRNRAEVLLDLTTVSPVLAEPSEDQIPAGFAEQTGDLQSDAIGLAARCVIERGNLGELTEFLQSGIRKTLLVRSSDQWARIVSACTIATLQGNVDEAIAHARQALAIGIHHGSPDARPTWIFQSSALHDLGATLHSDELHHLDATLGQPKPDVFHNNAFALFRSTAAWWFADRKSAYALNCLEQAIQALNLQSADLSLLPAVARLVEAAAKLDKQQDVPQEAATLLAQLGAHHVIVGLTPAWSFGPSSRLLALLNGSDALWEIAVADCIRQGQGLWRSQTDVQRNKYMNRRAAVTTAPAGSTSN
jgi:DNA-binding SARP family transcriptional activator